MRAFSLQRNCPLGVPLGVTSDVQSKMYESARSRAFQRVPMITFVHSTPRLKRIGPQMRLCVARCRFVLLVVILLRYAPQQPQWFHKSRASRQKDAIKPHFLSSGCPFRCYEQENKHCSPIVQQAAVDCIQRFNSAIAFWSPGYLLHPRKRQARYPVSTGCPRAAPGV